MSETSTLEKAAQRRVERFSQKYKTPLLHLAYHAALPAALTMDLVHLLRINFFFDGPEALPYTAEADLLLSPLCAEIGDELYEMDHEVRDILLQGLATSYGKERLREVASLLWQYDQHIAPWSDNDMLERAQQVTAISFINPVKARQWLTQQSTDQRPLEQKVWFTAMSKEIALAENIPQQQLLTQSQSTETITESMEHLQSLQSVFSTHAMPPTNEVAPAESIPQQGAYTLTRLQRRQLVELLLRIPDIDNYHARTALLIGIPGSLARDSGNVSNDLSVLVSQLTHLTLSSGESALQILLENAHTRVAGTHLEQELTAFQQQLIPQSQSTETITNPAEQPQSFQNIFSAHIVPSETRDDPISIFYCYAPEDEIYHQMLEKHLAILKRENMITSWSPHDIHPGEEWQSAINKAIQEADIILLLISPNFMASTQVQEEQVKPILSQYEAGTTRVIPIIVRSTAGWEESVFGRLVALPRGEKPVSAWKNRDPTFASITEDISKVVTDLKRTRHSDIR